MFKVDFHNNFIHVNFDGMGVWMWAFFRCQGIGSTGLTSAVAGDIRCHRTVKARCAAIRASAQGSRQACGGLDHRLYGIEPGGFNEMLRKASGACGFEGSVIATSSILNGATLKGPFLALRCKNVRIDSVSLTTSRDLSCRAFKTLNFVRFCDS